MIAYQALRVGLLTLVLGSVMAVFGKVAITPKVAQTTELPPVFLEDVPLPGWRSLDTESVPPATESQTELIGGNIYRYEANQKQLSIEMRYLAQLDPNIRNLLLKYGKATPTVSFPETIQQTEDGYYTLYSDSQAAYLSSCINPKGGSTVTASQFMQNRNAYDFRIDRLLPVLLGQQTIRDSRCLWTFMTLPIDDASPDTAYQELKDTWKHWQQWWQSRFPSAD